MPSRRGLHLALGITGLTAWLLFILACTGWPSWSPDGTKLLAPYLDPAGKQTGIALYDLRTKRARSIFTQPFEDDYWVDAQWESDGKRAIILATQSKGKSHQVMVLPVGSRKPARYFDLRGHDDLVLLPLPELKGKLFVGGRQLSRLDLQTGSMETTSFSRKDPETGEVRPGLENPVSLYSEGHRIYYVGGEDENLELGTVDPDTLELHPAFERLLTDLRSRGLGEPKLSAFVPEPRGSRIALLGETGDEDFIALCTLTGVDKILRRDFGIPGARIGTPRWAPGGKLLYVTVAAEVPKGQLQYWVGEIPVEQGKTRLTRIFRVNAKSNWNESLDFSRVSLSPDGRTIAITTADMPEDVVANEDRALYLVDLSDPRRTVTKIPSPRSAPSPEPKKD